MELVFIVNEASGGGARVWAYIERSVTRRYTLYKTAYRHHATEIVAKLAAQNEPLCIVVIGGDGTIHEVITAAIEHTHLIIGAFCAGSGNDFARAFSTFSTVQQLEAWYAHTATRVQDAGMLGQHVFMNNAGIGFDAHVVKLANKSKLKRMLNRVRLGKLSYVYFLMRGVLTYQTTDIVINDTTYKNVWFVTFSNQPYFGGGMKISPHSKTDDGMLECTIVHELSRFKLLAMFITVFWGGHTRFQEVTQQRSHTFTVQLTKPLVSHVDGEAFIMNDEHVHIQVKQHSWHNVQNE